MVGVELLAEELGLDLEGIEDISETKTESGVVLLALVAEF